jgi:ABC-2 type transport system permease protein
MRAYFQFAKKSFRRRAVYRLEYFLGLFNAILTIFIGAAIWEAVYNDNSMLAGIEKNQMITYAVLGMVMRTMLTMNEFIIDGKIQSGEIAVDLLKPLYFPRYIFSMILGEIGFNLWTKVLPVIVLSFFVFQLDLPASAGVAGLFAISLIFAYLLLYTMNFLFWLLAFWIHHTWSIITIKNSLLLLLSGATIPLWFLPAPLERIVSVLPFRHIYYTPLSIYLGQIQPGDIFAIFVQELLWIVVLYGAGRVLWQRAQLKLIIQGG